MKMKTKHNEISGGHWKQSCREIYGFKYLHLKKSEREQKIVYDATQTVGKIMGKNKSKPVNSKNGGKKCNYITIKIEFKLKGQ